MTAEKQRETIFCTREMKVAKYNENHKVCVYIKCTHLTLKTKAEGTDLDLSTPANAPSLVDVGDVDRCVASLTHYTTSNTDAQTLRHILQMENAWALCFFLFRPIDLFFWNVYTPPSDSQPSITKPSHPSIKNPKPSPLSIKTKHLPVFSCSLSLSPKTLIKIKGFGRSYRKTT